MNFEKEVNMYTELNDLTSIDESYAAELIGERFNSTSQSLPYKA